MTAVPTKTYYVYSLADINEPPFYIGKGKRGRLFAHEKEAFSGCTCDKCAKICSIWEAGREVRKAIHFETDNEEEAYDHETQLIGKYGYDQLCNKQPGRDPNDIFNRVQGPRRRRGTGSLYQRRNGRWCTEIYLGIVNGKRRHKSFYGDTPDESQSKAQAWHNMTFGTPPPEIATKLGAIMDDGRKMGSVIRASDIPAMRRAHAEGESYTSIGKRYGISNVAARNAIKGRTWKEVPIEA